MREKKLTQGRQSLELYKKVKNKIKNNTLLSDFLIGKKKQKKTQSLILVNYSNNWQNAGSCHAENDNFLIEQI